jgi:ATP adenylyltransferase
MPGCDEECLFCNIERPRVILENSLAFAVRDGFPVTERHSLIIPRRHVIDYFSLSQEELLACDSIIRQLSESIRFEDSSVQGFNIGINAGEVSGQTIFHCHIHLIPRRSGDVDNPRGGVRHIIPGKGFY